MHFDLTGEQQMLQELCRKIGRDFDNDYWQKIDDDYVFPWAVWDVVKEQGLLGINIPEEYGGSGLGMLELCLAAEAMAEEGSTEAGTVLCVGPVFGGCFIMASGNEEQKRKYLPAIVDGAVWCGAFTEPNSGSNITTIQTRAIDRGDHYSVNGQKVFISNVKNSNHMLLMCRTQEYNPSQRTAGVSLLVGDLPSASVEARPFKKMGSHLLDTNAVFFDDFRIPKENLVGSEGSVWQGLMAVLNPERLIIAAGCIGTGNYLIKKAVQYTNERSIWGGKPLSSHQGLQFPLAQARIQLETARLKTYHAAWLYDQGRECGVDCAMAKYAASHAALFAADRAIQTLGGAGYITESGIERHWRSLRLNRIAPVSDEMTLNYLAQHDLGMPRSY